MPRDQNQDAANARRSSPPPSTPRDEADNSMNEWDEISESSWESFPASDPPSWAGHGSSRQRHQNHLKETPSDN